MGSDDTTVSDDETEAREQKAKTEGEGTAAKQRRAAKPAAAAKETKEEIPKGEAAPAEPEKGEKPEPTAAEWEARRQALLAKVPVIKDRPKTLYGMLAQILGIIGAVEKRGYNAFHKYNFVKESDLVD